MGGVGKLKNIYIDFTLSSLVLYQHTTVHKFQQSLTSIAMKFSTTTYFALLASMAAVQAAPSVPVTYDSTELSTRDLNRISTLVKELDSHKMKRNELSLEELTKRENQIVTEVLELVKDTNVAPSIIHYFATNSTFQPIVINAFVALLKSGVINYTSLFNALDESNLLGTVIQQLISDCSLYVEIFNLAKEVIGNLVDKVTSAIQGGTSKRDLVPVPQFTGEVKRDDNEPNQTVVSLLESLGNSGLATQVVKSILTDSSYIPFAKNLIKAVIDNNALPLGDIIDALKESPLLPDLLKQIFSIQTLQTVITNAFAAFAGKCSNASQSSLPSATTSVTTPTACKRRRRRSNY